jgi:hypothetical protein
MILNFFFSIKLIRHSGGAKKIFRKEQITENIIENTIFQNSKEQPP